MTEQNAEQERSRADGPQHQQPDPESSSDGDRSWTEEPASEVDPDEDRSVEAVVDRSV